MKLGANVNINLKGLKSPCGIGAFDSSSPLVEYEKCYLSGLSKYYKSHNYNNQTNVNDKREKPRRAVSVLGTENHQASIDRSEYWNGEKF